MAASAHETVLIKTPQGHDVLAELDYTHFAVCRAKVVHTFTGVTRPLEGEALANLARALHARQIYEHAIAETRAIETTLAGLGASMAGLGTQHPAVAPYWHEATQHRAIARDMGERARHFHDHAMKAIDKIAGD